MTRVEIMTRFLSDEEFKNYMEEIEYKQLECVLDNDSAFYQWRGVGAALSGSFLTQTSLMGRDYWIEIINRLYDTPYEN